MVLSGMDTNPTKLERVEPAPKIAETAHEVTVAAGVDRDREIYLMVRCTCGWVDDLDVNTPLGELASRGAAHVAAATTVVERVDGPRFPPSTSPVNRVARFTLWREPNRKFYSYLANSGAFDIMPPDVIAEAYEENGELRPGFFWTREMAADT